MHRLFRTLEQVAPTRATVLVTGETGTGKELVAQGLHELSERRRGEFVPVVCSALPGSLLESELFGFVKGAFTGASESRMGLIERAAGGTLFLDEISTLSLDMQVKLLRVIQDRKIQRVGGRTLQHVDFRLVAATNRDLTEMVSAGDFREDLFYRLNVFPIRVPPLRARRVDIPLLADHFRIRFAREMGVEAPGLPGTVLKRMIAYPWPGNVRELEGFIERFVILAGDGDTPDFARVLGRGRAAAARGLVQRASGGSWTLQRLEREYILAVLSQTAGNRTEAARGLGISRRTLHRKLQRYREAGVIPPGHPVGDAPAAGG